MSSTDEFGRRGWQWLVDPDGRRWRIESFGENVAHLSDEAGYRLGVGKSVLQERGWTLAEFELAPVNGSRD